MSKTRNNVGAGGGETEVLIVEQYSLKLTEEERRDLEINQEIRLGIEFS